LLANTELRELHLYANKITPEVARITKGINTTKAL
jgi:hypothetical protein